METVCEQCERVVGANRRKIKDFNPRSYQYKVISMCCFCQAERAEFLHDPHLEFVNAYTLHRHYQAEFEKPAPKGA